MFGESDDGKLKSDTITLSTIHKSKGLESDNVYFLAPELIPSKYAETELDYFSENCLRYVAITRAKNKLIFVPLNNI
jgi:superfamily I DNA/RNA helicase